MGYVVEGMSLERSGYKVPRDHKGKVALGWRELGVEFLGGCRVRVA